MMRDERKPAMGVEPDHRPPEPPENKASTGPQNQNQHESRTSWFFLLILISFAALVWFPKMYGDTGQAICRFFLQLIPDRKLDTVSNLEDPLVPLVLEIDGAGNSSWIFPDPPPSDLITIEGDDEETLFQISSYEGSSETELMTISQDDIIFFFQGKELKLSAIIKRIEALESLTKETQ